eukprot:gnl/MRDRNA2_/MRDRNA2_82663_c0_seq1.p1 gnl/MRDRNA2_/MRDRNA2_82663_c0~~gnl/MRDRNA2_/MRDRNA2_82663_c0_seq1.p1  ORF type:complete len:1276 (-),score=281.97 gnl/MRDRNA2_/MRDRNA2_82663_c0_seq1:67-3462(-)
MLAADAETRSRFGLGADHHTRDSMRYTRMGQSKTSSIEGKTDAERFQLTCSALALVGVEGEVLQRLLRALGSVLLVGQIDIGGESPSQDDEATISTEAAAATKEAADVLGVEVSLLGQALTQRTLKARNESIVKKISSAAAAGTRDAMAKELYARLFDWLVERICQATSAASKDVSHFVGMLDIFGFESFAINRFEQLCINYANEKLQQKFTLDVFKAVQQEYTDEGIPWEKIEFKDNAPVLALIESKMGIVAMLNEECVRPKGSEENFVSKLSTVHKADPAFSVPKLGKMKELQFSIRHYAGEVMYTASGWLERNKDSISDDVLTCMRASSNSLIAEIFAEAPPVKETETKGGAKGSSDTVVTKFRNSLAQLMETVGKTTTQYVRCIKPNANKSPIQFNNQMVVEQLRCAGVIEVIKVSRAGFPARMPLKEFACRFNLLARSIAGIGFCPKHQKGHAQPSASLAANAKAAVQAVEAGKDWNAACRALMPVLSAEAKDKYEVGRTRMYFKAGILESLEERRVILQQSAATEVARLFRGRMARKHYLVVRRRVLSLQALRRMSQQRAKYLKQRAAVIVCQKRRRVVLATRLALKLRRERAAIKIQSFQRRRVAVRIFFHARMAAVRIQAVVRRMACRKQYLKDLVEFREQSKLENQVKALQAKLEARESEKTASSEPPEEVLEALHALANENAKLRIELEKARAEIVSLRRENQTLKAGQSRKSDWLNSILRSKKDSSFVEETSSEMGSPTRDADASAMPAWTEVVNDRRGSHGIVNAVSSGSKTGSEAATSPANQQLVVQLKLFQPLNLYWEDVPCPELPLLKSGSQVHIKLGPNMLMVDDSGKSLIWKQWMWSGDPNRPAELNGYRRSQAFFIERRAVVGQGATADEDLIGGHHDGSLGLAFALRSAITNKYVIAGGLLDRYCMRVTGSKAEDASVFMFVPLLDGAPPDEAQGADKSAAAYVFALRLLNENKMLSIRKDGYVSVSAVTDTDKDIVPETMAASIEHLRPVEYYEVTIEEEQIGITVAKDLPLRVVGFKPVTQAGRPPMPGPAERTGRVHVGDHIVTVNGQDITGVPRSDALVMIACKRPVVLGFTAADVGGDIVKAKEGNSTFQRMLAKRPSLMAPKSYGI